MTVNDYKNNIIDFVRKSSDLDNIIIASFIAGMEARKNTIANNDKNNCALSDKLPQN